MKALLRHLSNSFSSANRTTIQSLFESRKLFYQMTSQELGKPEFMDSLRGKSAYCGYDPTSDSLHLGNLVSIIMMSRLSLMGLKPIFLIGGATGLIGDPSGKIKERTLLDESVVQSNIASLQAEIGSVYQNIQNQIESKQIDYNISDEELQRCKTNGWKMVNNYKFYQHMNAIRFLRDVGKYFRMGALMAKETVANRLSSEEGISYAEFSYSIIQAYDFLTLLQQEQCVLQLGGSDQWGNITNGCELVRKIKNQEVYGITMPLLLTKTGQKFGKSEGNALYLNPSKTSSQAIFNYFLNSSDEDMEKYLKIFTFYPESKIQEILKEHEADKQKKLAQTFLAESVLRLIRAGETNVGKQRQFFTLSHEELLEKDSTFFSALFQKMKKDSDQYLFLSQKQVEGLVPDFLAGKKLVKSKSEVRREVEKGGFYINNKRVSSEELSMAAKDFLKAHTLFGEFVMLRWGKKKYQFLHFKK